MINPNASLDGMFHDALLVEDEAHLAQALEIALGQLKIPVRRASTLEKARELFALKEPEFILLDRQLPDGDGLDLCIELRAGGFLGSILILTAKGQTHDRVAGLTSGADDYLPKPFSWDELNARIFALSRRKPRNQTRVTKPDEAPTLWQRDPDRLRIFGELGWAELTPLEYKLASHLMDAAGAIVSRDELLKHVWGFTLLPKTRTVDHFLGRLRKRFETDPEMPRHFITVRGAGYRFEAQSGKSY